MFTVKRKNVIFLRDPVNTVQNTINNPTVVKDRLI